MKPKIAITTQYDAQTGFYRIQPFYSLAIEKFGGIPVFLPFLEKREEITGIADDFDGLILSGGGHVDPFLYSETPIDTEGNIEHSRDIFETGLVREFAKRDKPILGICRGCQLIAVANGGKLFQKAENHVQTADKHLPSHSVMITKDSMLYDILKADKIFVNSFHTQTVKEPGKLKICGISDDGKIESIFDPDKKFILGVQWHPERMYQTDEHAKRIFGAFIESAEK